MPDENDLSTPTEGEETPPEGAPPEGEETPPESGEGTPETPETETETVSFEDHQKLQARLAFAERELRRKGREKPEEPETQKPAVQTKPLPAENGKPNAANFEDYNDFVEALTDWKTDRKFEALEEKNKKASVEEQREERQQRVDGIIATETVKDPDFLKKAYIPNGLEDLVVDSDQFVELALYFGKHPDEGQRLVYLPPVQAAREIGRIEATLKTTVPQRTKTSAPTPTKTVGGHEVAEKSVDNMSTGEYIAYMNKKEFGQDFAG